MSRIIGELGGNEKGPLIILIGGLHGNELTGIKAIERVFKKIADDKLEIRGKIIGLKGNKKAIEKKKDTLIMILTDAGPMNIFNIYLIHILFSPKMKRSWN